MADVLVRAWHIEPFAPGPNALRAEGTVFNEKIVVVKPLTFMNRSGIAVRELLGIDGFDLRRDLLVVVDDVALPLGVMRIRTRGSSGGHNGLESISEAAITDDYARLRVGVGPAPEGDYDLADFVLDDFAAAERETIAELMPTVISAVECWVTEGIDAAMNRFNQRISESE